MEAMGFSPRNGEIILKVIKLIRYIVAAELCFSPRNGEIILKKNK